MEQKQLEELKQIQKDYRAVFSSEEGKRVLEDMKVRGFFYTSTFSGNVEGTIYNEGIRSHVLHTISMIEQPYDEILKLMGDGKGKESVFDLE